MKKKSIFKFEVGQIVMHASNVVSHNTIKLLIISRGFLDDGKNKSIIYRVSFQRNNSFAVNDPSFANMILEESELTLYYPPY